jgi:hypothetical protein
VEGFEVRVGRQDRHTTIARCRPLPCQCRPLPYLHPVGNSRRAEVCTMVWRRRPGCVRESRGQARWTGRRRSGDHGSRARVREGTGSAPLLAG